VVNRMFGNQYTSAKREKRVYLTKEKVDVLYNISVMFVGRKLPTEDRQFNL
jgi:hypothetical protein